MEKRNRNSLQNSSDVHYDKKQRLSAGSASAGNHQPSHIHNPESCSSPNCTACSAGGEIEIDKQLLQEVSALDMYVLAKEEKQRLLQGAPPDYGFGFEHDSERVLIRLYEKAIEKFQAELRSHLNPNPVKARLDGDGGCNSDIAQAKLKLEYVLCLVELSELLRIQDYALEGTVIAQDLLEITKELDALDQTQVQNGSKICKNGPPKLKTSAFYLECIIASIKSSLLSTIFDQSNGNSLDDLSDDEYDDCIDGANTADQPKNIIYNPNPDVKQNEGFPQLASLFCSWKHNSRIAAFSDFSKNAFKFISDNIPFIWAQATEVNDIQYLDMEVISLITGLTESMQLYTEINPSLKQENRMIFAEFVGVLCHQLYKTTSAILDSTPSLRSKLVVDSLFEIQINCCKSLVLAYQLAGNIGILEDYNLAYIREPQRMMLNLVSEADAKAKIKTKVEAKVGAEAEVEIETKSASFDNQNEKIKLANILKLLAETKLVEISSFLVENEDKVIDEYESVAAMLRRAFDLNPNDQSIIDQLKDMGVFDDEGDGSEQGGYDDETGGDDY